MNLKRIKFEEDPKNINKHMKYLVLAMNLYQAPLRITLPGMKFTTDNSDFEKKANFLYLNPSGMHMYFIHDDKVANKKSDKQSKIDLYPEARRIINLSYKELPRKYVLTTLTDLKKPLSKQSYSQLLKRPHSEITQIQSRSTLRTILGSEFSDIQENLYCELSHPCIRIYYWTHTIPFLHGDCT